MACQDHIQVQLVHALLGQLTAPLFLAEYVAAAGPLHLWQQWLSGCSPWRPPLDTKPMTLRVNHFGKG